MTGTVNRVEPRAIILDVGKNVEAILATTEQSALEHYRIGQNVKAFVLEVRRSTKGPQIFVSRTHKGFLKRLFELEVPEIHNGTVEIKAIAREAGSRSKVAVSSRQDGLDPVGATVGQRGARVQAVVAELSGEKIDVIPWSDDASVFVANALSPAQVISVDIDEEHRIASVTVPERMLSLAIGREGQNARLAARLTGWRIDIRSDVSVAEAKAAADAGPDESTAEVVVATTPRRPRGREAQAGDQEGGRRAAEADADATPVADATDAEATTVAKPKRATKAKAAVAEADADADAGRRAPTADGRQAEASDEGRSRGRRRRCAGRRGSRDRRQEARDQGEGHQEGRRCRSLRGGGVVAGAARAVAPRRVPNRTCVACRTVRPKRELMRIVRTPTGDVILDETGRAAGRGAYVCRTGDCLDKALTKGALSRALKTPLPPETRDALAGSLTNTDMNIEGGARGQE